jgi:hypothetical protein
MSARKNRSSGITLTLIRYFALRSTCVVPPNIIIFLLPVVPVLMVHEGMSKSESLYIRPLSYEAPKHIVRNINGDVFLVST